MAILTVGSGGTYATIQTAINAAASGDTILVAAGTYREQITVNGKDLTIHGAGDGAGGTIIESPDAASLVVNARDSNNSGRPNKFAVVAVTGNADVTIEGVAVDGREQGFLNCADYDFVGVYVLNSDAHINGVAVSNIDERVGPVTGGAQRNTAIIATSHDLAHGGNGAHTVTIEHSTVSNFQKAAILVNGPTLTVDIHDNTITGTETANQSQNGMQVGSSGAFAGTKGTIDHNTITNIDNPNGGATGILVYHADASLAITNNDVSGINPNDQNSGIVVLDSNGGIVQGNSVSGFAAALTDEDVFGPETTVLSHSGNIYTNDAINILLAPDATGTTPITFSGSQGHDELHGTAVADTLSGGVGDDTLDGGAGNDILDGGDGSDTVLYSSATNSITIDLNAIDRSNEPVRGADGAGPNPDTIGAVLTAAGYAPNTLVGKADGVDIGTDALINVENVVGGSGADTLIGDSGNNILDGGAGADTMTGGAGNDTYVVDNTGDVVTEALNGGTDTVQASITYTLGANVENLTLTGSGAINGTGNSLDNVITGNSSNNTLDGGAGDDTFLYTIGAGVDTINGGIGSDTFAVSGTSGDDTVHVAVNGSGAITSIEGMSPINVENYTVDGLANGAGGDTLDYSGTTGTVIVNLGTHSGTGFTSVTNFENVTGGSGNDLLAGDSGNNRLDGGAGGDAMVGGSGNDTYLVENVGDVVTEAPTRAPTRCSRRSRTRSAPMSRTLP